jgi:glycosyltransferase involved in cell wall biosynthesis
MTAPVSVIIPILNEAETLPQLLLGLEQQALLPHEIIFVDAGSTDGGPGLIQTWWKAKGWPEGDCRVLSCPGALPGAGRNTGIESARNAWIAFLDGGMTPETCWLAALTGYAKTHGGKAVFGVCRFSGQGAIGRAVCALSYGHGTIRPIVAASLFDCEIFKRVGLFRYDLLAAEDIHWIARYEDAYNTKPICQEAVVHYKYFPNSFVEALKKWFRASTHVVKAGTGKYQQAAYLLGFSVWCVWAYAKLSTAFLAFGAYAIFRGILIPAWRSHSWYWWKGEARSFVAAVLLGIGLDLAKTAGFLIGYIEKATMSRPTGG